MKYLLDTNIWVYFSRNKQLNYNDIVLFTILNILLFLLLSIIYNGGFNYFYLTVFSVITPILFGLVINIALWSLIKNRTANYIWTAILFLTNEIAFGIYENWIILFGTIKQAFPPNIIQPDQSDYFFISISSIIAAIIVTFSSFNKSKSSDITNEQINNT